MYKRKVTLFYFFLFLVTITTAQKEQKNIKGLIKDYINVVVDANIFNLTTNEGTFTSEKGCFEILVSIGDSIQISSVPHTSKTIVISKEIYDKETIDILLEIAINILDEVKLKNHNLTGILEIDLKNAKPTRRDSTKTSMQLSFPIGKGELQPDITDTKVKPPENNVDPTSKFVGLGFGFGLGSRFVKKEREKKEHLKFLENFPQLLLKELGEEFFFVKLKIPKERYYHFLEYCNPLGIEKLYKDRNKLEVIKILKEEHTGYLKIINEKE